MPPNNANERQPLLNGHHRPQNEDQDSEPQILSFSPKDPSNPLNWPLSSKYLQTALITLIALSCPMASSITAPAASNIQASFPGSTQKQIILGQAVFVMMLGLGPLFLAPMSETFGRRPVFLICLGVFTILQIPTGLAPNVGTFVAMRALAGFFFGSVGVANGGGTISDVFERRERARVLGVYLVGPLLGPTIGPLLGGLIVGGTGSWRWLFLLTGGLAGLATVVGYFCLFETRAVTLLLERKRALERENPGKRYVVEGTTDQGLLEKIKGNSTRAVKILTTQPIVSTMSLYQALVFSSMYSLYSQYTSIWSAPPYEFSKKQIGLTYLGPAVGFIICAVFIVLFIDKVYSALAERNGDEGQPEYRLPMANVGAVFLPISLFWFGWAVEKNAPWPVPVLATMLFGASQVSIFNCVQTYYIDAYETNAASALAAGAFLRSVVGGIVPLFVSGMFEQLGYGWGMSVFGFLSVLLMPAPAVFYWTGRRVRERFPFKG
ncbi:hypothetical protein M409DRAFT_62131 [Zasmidium cellare ATCC 36951]|uniref:Major facilitator superfamily (MFS) profile domain-containing protein n=1 Tax=Zasmidium cellare ATCC 36951 TaxID=1080233 RepID=A0A6A6D6Q6_ZASCE|nr:uncharacterized protein M409DRAFT_62131 [Zasmidium cellare ATCC 36951]KAF2173912.1 hypothetical protein M409DRAFT_62131 [Zasmidium cellare ATCC 36951]